MPDTKTKEQQAKETVKHHATVAAYKEKAATNERKKKKHHEVQAQCKTKQKAKAAAVIKSCEIYYLYSDLVVEPQNLNFLWEFIMCNIDNDMRAIVNAESSSYIELNPMVAQSGPMAFHVIANHIIHCMSGLAHNVVTGLMGMGLCHFKGKNLVDCVATLCSVLMFLGHGTPLSQTSPTLIKILVDIFLCCSNAVFVTYVCNLSDFYPSDIDTPKKLFAKVEVYYNELLMKPNGWIRLTKNCAAFTAELPELDAILEVQGMT